MGIRKIVTSIEAMKPLAYHAVLSRHRRENFSRSRFGSTARHPMKNLLQRMSRGTARMTTNARVQMPPYLLLIHTYVYTFPQ